MNILAFDTSQQTCSVVLQYQHKMAAQKKCAEKQQGSLILPMIESVLQENAFTLNQLDAISFTDGPGSFTGIRIGSCVAQSLSFAHDIPVIPISTLAALAQTAYLTHGFTHLFVALDARMGQIYWAEYVIDNSRAILIGKEQQCAPHEVRQQSNEPNVGWIGIGDGWIVYQDILEAALQCKVTIQPKISIDAEALLPLAAFKYNNHEWVRAFDAQPAYLR